HAERKALLSATDQLSRLPDGVLGDIGISRDEIMCALQSRATRPAEAGAASTIERTRIASASIHSFSLRSNSSSNDRCSGGCPGLPACSASGEGGGGSYPL
ncbi:MAG: DUF1127 domain-containing protein, partial [Mesorhizobium sp.]